MKVLSCQLENFASYKELNFNFDNNGLTLISGPTGSGKSTLCDAIPWCLFGRTAKDGAVDEVLSWPGNQITSGTLSLDVASLPFTVVRTRGPSAKDNDLYFRVQDGPPKRGKDLKDTQRILNEYLGTDIDLYLASAYFHEFSKFAQFFITTAKTRKEICDQIVDLSLATTLQTSLSDQSKVYTKQYAELDRKLSSSEDRVSLLKRLFQSEVIKRDKWNKNFECRHQAFEIEKTRKLQRIASLTAGHATSLERYEVIKGQLNSLDTTPCQECGAPKHTDRRQELQAELHRLELSIVREKDALTQADTIQNSQLTQTESENPHEAALLDLQHSLDQEIEAQELYKNKELEFRTELSDLEVLSDVVKDFRGVVVKNTIVELEAKTNRLISDYFDAELSISFSIPEADKIEFSILKNGNQCTYTQLSKGQRCMLKLAFGVATMAIVQNHRGISPNAVWFDESLDGCDDSTKLKALRLFENLTKTYSSVFLVEHSEVIKASIDNKYSVALVNGMSIIAKT